MADYGLTTVNKKFGSGSFFSPYGSTTAKSLAIEPTAGNFSIAAGQDFIISVWVNYDDPLTTSTRSDKQYNPVIQYGFGATNGAQFWGLGWESRQLNPNLPTRTPAAYFQFNTKLGVNPPVSNIIQANYTGSNSAQITPNGWSNWLVQRTSGVITFTFTNSLGTPVVSTVSNNQEIAPFTDSRYNTLYVGATNPVSGTSGAYIDELFFARGVSSVAQRNAVTGAINDGLLTSTAFLYQFDGNYYDDETGTKEFSAALASTTAVAAELTYVPSTKQFSAGLTSAFTTTASAAGPVLAQAALTTTSTITASAVRTRIAASALATTSTITANVIKLKFATANLTAFNTQVTVGTETRTTSRPYTLYTISGSAGNTKVPVAASDISTSRFKYGTGSLTVPGYVGGLGGTYAAVNPGSTTSNFAIGASTDFYISFWSFMTTTLTSPGVGVYIPIFQVAGLNIGYYSNVLDPFLRNTGGDFSPIFSTGNITANTWHQWEAYRIGSTITFKFNGVEAGTRTYSGATATGSTSESRIAANSQIIIGADGTQRSFNFDEVFFAIGANSVQYTQASGEIRDGSLATTQVLYHFNGNAIDDITGIQTTTAALSSTSTLAALGSEISSGAANLTTTANITASINRVRSTVSSQTSSFSAAITAGVIRQGASSISSNSSIAVESTRIKFAQAALASAATQTANTVKTTQTGSNLTAFVTTLTVNTRKLVGIASMFADTAITANAMVVRTVESNLENTVILTANAVRTVGVSANLTTNSSSSLQAIAVKRISANLTSSSTQSTRADRFARFAAGLTTSATLVARPVQEVKSSISVSATLAVTAGVRRGTARANLSTQVLWSYIYDKTIPLNQALDLWIIPADTRLYVVPESRANWIIESDSRTYIIEPDIREYQIPPGNTEFTIEG